jgi:hypothetical protein
MEGIAGHADDGVEVELEVVRNALFDREVVRFGALEPGAEFGEGEDGAYDEDEDGPLAAATGGVGVGGLCFGWKLTEGEHFRDRPKNSKMDSVQLSGLLTESVECLEAALRGRLLPERILVEPVGWEPIHHESASRIVADQAVKAWEWKPKQINYRGRREGEAVGRSCRKTAEQDASLEAKYPETPSK